MEEETKLLTFYSEIKSKAVNWIWYPYIPLDKITIVQGDPGDGKSTMMINLIAEISKGGVLPDGTELDFPRRVLYQCSEDSATDTIKPRLMQYDADCKNIAFIDEDVHSGLTIADERLRKAIEKFRPWLVVIDPIQSYIENDSDLKMAARARKLMRRIGIWASTYRCAFVLIGHQNKNEGTKGLYRNLGSIDIVAAARSILQVVRNEQDTEVRIVSQIKNNLAPLGTPVCFEIKKDTGFRWLPSEITEKKTKTDISFDDLPKNKHELAAMVIKKLLQEGITESTSIRNELSNYGIGAKTIQEVKVDMGIKSVRKMRKWYWIDP